MGSSISKHIERVSDKVSLDYHLWSSKFGFEYAIVYRALGTKPGICTTYCSNSKCREQAIYTFCDAMCEDNIVAVNIEFVAIRDGDDGPYKFGPIKAIEYGENYTARRRRPVGPEVLFLSYEMGRRRKNQLAFRRKGAKYEIVFDSESHFEPLYYSVQISCDPSKGLIMDWPRARYRELLNFKISKPPHDDVVKDANDVRRKLMEDAGSAISYGNNTVVASLSYSQDDVISNTGQNQGLLHGSNLRHCQIHIEGSRFHFYGSQNR